MTEFKAPPLPKAPAFQPTPAPGIQPQPVLQPEQQSTQNTGIPTGLFDDNFAADFNLPPSILKTKPFLVMLGVILVFGMVLGAGLFGSSGTPKQQNTGLQGVVVNQDITRKLPRCGLIDRGQACVLYIVNHTRYDKKAREFFDEAVRLTEVQKYSISIANPKYAETRIPPGHFAQIQIPNVR